MSGRQVRPGWLSSEAATSARLSKVCCGARMPLRAASTKPRYCVSPSYTHRRSSFIGCWKSGVARPAGRRYLPFHEWTSSCESRFECAARRSSSSHVRSSTRSSLDSWCSSPKCATWSLSVSRKWYSRKWRAPNNA